MQVTQTEGEHIAGLMVVAYHEGFIDATPEGTRIDYLTAWATSATRKTIEAYIPFALDFADKEAMEGASA